MHSWKTSKPLYSLKKWFSLDEVEKFLPMYRLNTHTWYFWNRLTNCHTSTLNKALSFIQMRSINVLLFPVSRFSRLILLLEGNAIFMKQKFWMYFDWLHVVCQSMVGKSALDVMIDNFSLKLYHSFLNRQIFIWFILTLKEEGSTGTLFGFVQC